MYPWKRGKHVDLKDTFVPLTIDVKIPGARKQHFKKPLQPYTEFLSKDQTYVRFVLSGDPGQGKSTFCAKLAYDWSDSERAQSAGLDHIQLLFILQLGKLDRRSNIEDAICSQLLSDGIEPSFVRDILNRDLPHDAIAIVFDGLDEAPTDLVLKKKEANSGNVVKILQYKDMRELRVLVTTRPWRESEMQHYPVYERLELRKMTKSDALKLVFKFFNQNPTDLIAVFLGKRLQGHIEHNKHCVDTSTPLAVLLLCWYWAETDGKKPIPKTRHELYKAIFNIMYKTQERPSSQLAVSIDNSSQCGLQNSDNTWCFNTKSEVKDRVVDFFDLYRIFLIFLNKKFLTQLK